MTSIQTECVLAAGTENMSLIPHLVYGSRFGTRFGPIQTVDMLMDSLHDKHADSPMAITAENLAQDFNITREDCDRFGKQSHDRASEAYKKNLLTGEIAPVQGKKQAVTKVCRHLESFSLTFALGRTRSRFCFTGRHGQAEALLQEGWSGDSRHGFWHCGRSCSCVGCL